MTTSRAQLCSTSTCMLLLIAAWIGPSSPAFAEVTASFRYPLSNFSGPVPSQWAKLAVDRERNEIYALNQHQNDIRIFDEHGMEIFVFGEDFTSAADLAIGDDGNIFVLTKRYQTFTVHVCNYRGERVSTITPRDVPDAFADFKPDRLTYTKGSLYLVDSNLLIIVVVDTDGTFKQGYDLYAALRRLSAGDERAQEKLRDLGMNGFSVDKHGNMFFTVPSLFAAFRMSPHGELAEFGTAGSGQGKFGVTGGIVTDDTGYIYVSDRLRCVVLIFDHNFAFQTEFGYRGHGPSNLIVPDDLAIDGNGDVYVGQASNRGVSVFRVVRK